MASARSALTSSALGAGASYGNLAVALPLLALAAGGSPSLAGGLIATNTIAFSLGALLATRLVRPEAAVAVGLAALAAGGLVLAASGGDAGLAAGAIVHGSGMGLFWVGVQAALGRRSGESESPRAFVWQYAFYVAGTATGGVLTGALAALLRTAGVSATSSLRLTFLLGATAALGALPPVLGWLRRSRPEPRRRSLASPLHGLALQLPDFLLVGAMGMLLNLLPVLLEHGFSLSPLAIGVVTAAVAGAKIAGSMTAGRLTRAAGSRLTVGTMLTGSALAAALLVGSGDVLVFVGLVLAATILGIGVWPVVVDGALARVEPAERYGLAVVWNVREYAAIAAAIASGGFLLDLSERPDLVLGLAAAMLAGSAASALAVLGRPVHAPRLA